MDPPVLEGKLSCIVSVHLDRGRSGTSSKPLAIGRRTATTDESSPRKQADSLDSVAGPHERLHESPAPALLIPLGVFRMESE